MNMTFTQSMYFMFPYNIISSRLRATLLALYCGGLSISSADDLNKSRSSLTQVPLPNSEIVKRYNLANPNTHKAALVMASDLQNSAEKLARQGLLQTQTPDFRSVSGRASSSSNVRSKGAANIKQAEVLMKDSESIRTEVNNVKKYYLAKATNPARRTVYTIVSKDGRKIEARIIEPQEKGFIIQRLDGEFMLISMNQLSSESGKAIGRVVMDMIYSTMNPARKLRLPSSSHDVELLAESAQSIMVREGDGSIKSIQYSFPDGSFAKQAQARITDIQMKISKLELQRSNAISGKNSELTEIYKKTGDPQTFIVERALSFDKFPLGKYGEFIYQVSIGTTPVILVTRETKYTTTGRGTLLLKRIGNFDVTMADGSLRNVPAFVEVEQKWIDLYNSLNRDISETTKDFDKSLKDLKDKSIEQSNIIQTLNDNNLLVSKVRQDGP